MYNLAISVMLSLKSNKDQNVRHQSVLGIIFIMLALINLVEIKCIITLFRILEALVDYASMIFSIIST